MRRMNAGSGSLEYRRLRAPSEHGAALVEPPLSSVGRLLPEQSARRQVSAIQIAGVHWHDFALQARAEMLAAATRYTAAYRDVAQPDVHRPICLAGHQPELFHPGVWFKNFLLGHIARQHQATAVNLVIDSDTLRAPSIRVPGGSVAAPTSMSVVYDAAGGEVPFEERPILDRALLASFADRVVAQIESLVPAPLVRRLWPLVLERSRDQSNLGLCLAQGRHRLEGNWGCQTLELPQSQVCDLPSFRRFLACLLDDLPRLATIHNEAVADYRRLHRLRSITHPVPDLVAEDGWQEAPLWIWRRDDPRRRRLFVRRSGSDLELTDRHGTTLRLPASQNGSFDAALAALDDHARRGIKIRTRALITTLWARLILSDLFVHGIGGAKYDQVTDQMIAALYGVEPPVYLTATATLRLPVAERPTSRNEALQIDQTLRNMTFHPETFLDVDALHASAERSAVRARELIETKRRWIATPPDRHNARDRCRAIRHANESLQPWLADERLRLESRRDQMATRLQAQELLGSREFSFCLFPQKNLQDFYAGIFAH
jgi:hypothetical protein